RRRDHLAAAAERERFARDRLEAPAVMLEHEPERHHIKRHGLEHALVHEHARHARIVLEVAIKEPILQQDLHHRLEIAALPRPTLKIDDINALEKLELLGADPQHANVSLGELETRPKALKDAAVREGTDLLGREALPLTPNARLRS